MKTFTLAIATAIVMASGANAQESTPVAPIETMESVETEQTNPLFDQFATICTAAAQNYVILSTDAANACATMTAPPVIADGSRFSKRGIGDEMNTLIRNVAFLTSN